MKIRRRAVVLTALVLAAVITIVASYQLRPTKAQRFWKRFQTANSAWLDPQPPQLSYEIVIQEKKHDRSNAGYVWYDSHSIQTWCAPAQSVRFLAKRFNPLTGQVDGVREERYLRGKGNKVTIPPQMSLRRLRADKWLAARTGAAFLTPLHSFTWWRLPKTAAIEENEDMVLLRVNQFNGSHNWPTGNTLWPTYGLHPAAFGMNMLLAPENVEFLINRQTLLPLRITQDNPSSTRSKAVITFEEPWLQLDGKPVPGRVKCLLPDSQWEILYQFRVQQGLWLISDISVNWAGTESLAKRAFLKDLEVGNIPQEIFVLPGDVDLPQHSETTLAEGERIIDFKTDDGLTLEGKLSVPPGAQKSVPVVFFLPGAGPWTFDRPIEYPDVSKTDSMFPEMKIYNYCDFYAQQLTKRGIAFFRINKRGCAVVKEKPYERVNRSTFSKATPTVLLADYRAALDKLRQQPDIDRNQIVLLGASEGTRLAPRLAQASPEGIIALVMLGYAEDNTKDTITWQLTVGPWRNMAKIFDEDDDGKVTKAEYHKIIDNAPTSLTTGWSFRSLDRNSDGIIAPKDMQQKKRLERILKAVRKRDDDYLWQNLLNLSSAYLLEDWNAKPSHRTLLKLNIPLAIFHGQSDGTCRVEGVLETQKAFEKANKKNLLVRTYPKTDHDLNWPTFLRDGTIPEPYEDLFAFIDTVVKTD